jgi:hypothetical protein
MGSKTRSQIRVEQSRREFNRTQVEISEWCAKWEARDKRRQFYTSLRLLEEVLTRSLAILSADLQALPGERQRGEVYAECGRSDRHIAWVRRLWQYYAAKFDQRENPKLKRVLVAADEIVWSCYAEVFQNANGGAVRGPAPLPYIEPLYTAQATPRIDIPPDLRSDVDREFLSAALAQLPISLVALPAQCVDAPWWLIFLGHEVGHHVQFDLSPPRELFLSFGKSLADALDPTMPGERDRWKRWSPEIFADAFSVYALGPWAARAIAELEIKDDLAMLRETNSGRSAYPAPWVRLRLLTALVAALDANDRVAACLLTQRTLPTPSAPQGGQLREQAAFALAAVPKIVHAIVHGSMANLGTLRSLCGWQSVNFSRGGSVDQWAQVLQGDPAALREEPALPTPRLIISGGLAAWSKVSAIKDDNEAERARANLIENLLTIIPRCAEEGVRAAQVVAQSAPQQFADNLAMLLRQDDATIR